MALFPRLSVNWAPKPKQEPDPLLIAAHDLNEAKLDLLKAEKELEYWQNWVATCRERASRLRKHLIADDIL